MPHPRRRELAVGKTISIRIELNEIVEVWRGGDWQCLIPSESLEIIRKREAHVRSFVISSNRGSYDIDLDSMTRRDHLSGRTRAIRFTHVEGLQDSGNWDFDKCKDFFTDMASGNAESEPLLTQDDLLCKWPGAVMDGDLLGETVREAFCPEHVKIMLLWGLWGCSTPVVVPYLYRGVFRWSCWEHIG